MIEKLWEPILDYEKMYPANTEGYLLVDGEKKLVRWGDISLEQKKVIVDSNINTIQLLKEDLRNQLNDY